MWAHWTNKKEIFRTPTSTDSFWSALNRNHTCRIRLASVAQKACYLIWPLKNVSNATRVHSTTKKHLNARRVSSILTLRQQILSHRPVVMMFGKLKLKPAANSAPEWLNVPRKSLLK
jgi:hypothetical protein